MLCLANSIRENGRCVAGIDIDTGEWIRPVPQSCGCIPAFRTMVKGEQLAVLDVVKIELNEDSLETNFQCENRVILDWNWKLIDRFKPKDVIGYCDNTAPILYCTGDRVDPIIFNSLSPGEWKSLQLVKPQNLNFYRDDFNRRRWRAHFNDINDNGYYLKITDPVISSRLNIDDTINSNSLLTISLAQPWSPDNNTPERCYKLVAAIIEL
jgi:hypothetical protein